MVLGQVYVLTVAMVMGIYASDKMTQNDTHQKTSREVLIKLVSLE